MKLPKFACSLCNVQTCKHPATLARHVECGTSAMKSATLGHGARKNVERGESILGGDECSLKSLSTKKTSKSTSAKCLAPQSLHFHGRSLNSKKKKVRVLQSSILGARSVKPLQGRKAARSTPARHIFFLSKRRWRRHMIQKARRARSPYQHDERKMHNQKKKCRVFV